uniref:Uncharacterized protein n=1 Tax=Globodera rostochiensis TaxID=31243 RepID=A0A914IEF9_GLORO
MKIIVLTIFCVAPWFCFGLKCKYNGKESEFRDSKIVECQTDEHYCASANCTGFNDFTAPRSFDFTNFGCFHSTDSQKCSELFTPKSYYGRNFTCKPCFIGGKDVDFGAGNVSKRLKCKHGEEGGLSNHSGIVECRELNSGFWSLPEVVKAVYNVTKWDCAEDDDLRYGMSADIADIDMVCDEPRFIGEKDVDLANINYTGVFPTAREYKLAGREPPPPPTTTEEPRPTTTTGKGDELSSTMIATKNGVDSVFINLLLVVLTFAMA